MSDEAKIELFGNNEQQYKGLLLNMVVVARGWSSTKYSTKY